MSHPQAQPTGLRPSAPQLATQPQPLYPPQQPNPLINHVVAGHALHTGVQYVPPNLGAPTATMVQNAQPPPASSFPVFPAAASSTGLAEQQPVVTGLVYMAQQPAMHYSGTGLPLNFNPLQHQQKMGLLFSRKFVLCFITRNYLVFSFR